MREFWQKTYTIVSDPLSRIKAGKINISKSAEKWISTRLQNEKDNLLWPRSVSRRILKIWVKEGWEGSRWLGNKASIALSANTKLSLLCWRKGKEHRPCKGNMVPWKVFFGCKLVTPELNPNLKAVFSIPKNVTCPMRETQLNLHWEYFRLVF